MQEMEEDIEKIIFLRQTNPRQLISINPVLQAIVDGVCDENCLLSIFQGFPHILQTIWNNVSTYWQSLIKKAIQVIPESQLAKHSNVPYEGYYRLSSEDVCFPKPTDININMMPFVMEKTFEKCKLPLYLKSYWDQVINKQYFCGTSQQELVGGRREKGKIGYLTIHESYVEENTSQRRSGLHTDCPGKLLITKNEHGDYICMGRVTNEEEALLNDQILVGGGLCNKKIWTHPWGLGSRYKHTLVGGIYMASTLSNSCEVWNCRIVEDENKEEIIGNLGDIEHLREFLPKGEVMQANKMYWITDRTPHESLPLPKSEYRQYFRLVTSQVGIWFEEHSTKNPLGVVPDPAITTIVKGSKFDKYNLKEHLEKNL